MSKRFTNGKVNPRRMICAYCLKGNCGNCTNIPLKKLGLADLCECKKEAHHG